MERGTITFAKIISLTLICSYILDGINRYYKNINVSSSFMAVLIELVVLFFEFLLYFPLFYFAWSKNKNNKKIKYWARGITFIVPIVIVILIYLVSFNLQLAEIPNLFEIILIIIEILALVPIYYYAWKN